MTNEITVTPSREIGQVEQEPEAFSLIRYAMEKGVDSSVMQQMMSVRRELQAEKAKKDYGDSMAAFQLECPPVIKTKSVEGAYKYAPFDEVIQAVKACEAKHGFQHKLDTVDTEQGWVIAICKVTHSGGHSEESRVRLPIGGKTRMMSDTQVYAGAQSFALRRAFCNAFGIVPQGEDMDGRIKEQPKGPNPLHGAAAPTNSEKLLKRALVDATRKIHRVESGYALDEAAIGALTQWLVDEAIIADTETVGDLSGERLVKAIEKAKEQLR